MEKLCIIRKTPIALLIGVQMSEIGGVIFTSKSSMQDLGTVQE